MNIPLPIGTSGSVRKEIVNLLYVDYCEQTLCNRITTSVTRGYMLIESDHLCADLLSREYCNVFTLNDIKAIKHSLQETIKPSSVVISCLT